MISKWTPIRGALMNEAAFLWPAQDAGSGAVSTSLVRGSGTLSFTRATTATTVLSNGLIGSVSSGTARSWYDPAPAGGQGSYMYLPGVSGAYASTPSTATLGNTGNKWITGSVNASSYTPASNQTICGKFQAVNGWAVQITTTGRLRLYDGTSNIDSTVAIPAADGSEMVFAVEHITNDGSNQRVTKFFVGISGSDYIQLGSTVTTPAAAALAQNGELSVGAHGAGASAPFNGRINRVVFYNGTQSNPGSAIADFNPSGTTQGSASLSATTGETWTLNGQAYIYAAPLYGGYLAEPASTNLVLQSEDFNTTWAAVGTPTFSSNTADCGIVTLDTIGDDAAGALEGYTQNVTFTGNAVKAVSVFVKQGTSASSVIRLRDTTASADRLLAAITWSAGAPVVTMTTGTDLGAKAFPDGVWRIQLATTSVTASNINSLEFYPAADAALSVANTGNVQFGGMMAENSTAPSSYIPTTTGTVTRNADVMTIAGGGNVNASEITAFCEIYPIAFVANTRAMGINDGTQNNRSVDMYFNPANTFNAFGNNAGVSQFNVAAPGTLVSGANKCAAVATTNFANAYLSGNEGAADTSVTMPSAPTQIEFMQLVGANQPIAAGSNFAVWKRVLSSAEIRAL